MMKYRELADTNILISELTAGNTAPMPGVYGDVRRKEDAVAAIRFMLENGVNLIDTASSYAEGESELIVGCAIRDIPRDRFMIVTKFGMTFRDTKESRQILPDLSKDYCIKECEQSLKRMNTDYVDIFMPHIPDYDCNIDDTIEAMERLRDQGKIRFLGLSNFRKKTIEKISKLTKISMIEMPYSLIDREYEETLLWAKKNHISTMVYGALGDGILAGAYTKAPDITDPTDTRAGYPFFFEPDFSKCMDLMRTIRAIAEKRGVLPSQVTINWMRRSPAVTTTILGTGSVHHAEENIEALNFELTDEEMNEITEAADVSVGRGVNNNRFYDTGGET